MPRCWECGKTVQSLWEERFGTAGEKIASTVCLAPSVTRCRETFPGSLPDQEYLDVVAYILEMNGAPSGRSELTLGRVPAIRVQGEHGPGPVPDSSLVLVRGCLAGATDGGWLLTDGSMPIRTRDPGADAEPLESLSPGTATYRLLSVYPSQQL